MKNRYFWPYYTGLVILLIWLVVSCVSGTVVTHLVAEKGNYPPIYFFPLLIFTPIGILLIPILLTFVKVTDDEFICFKYGLLRCRIKFSDITEWGTYIKNSGRRIGCVLYITSIPIFDLRCGQIINKKALRHKNKRKFIMLGYDDKRFIAFLKDNFPLILNRKYLYEKQEYIGSVDESKSVLR